MSERERGRCREASQLRTYSFTRYLLVKGSLQLRDLLQEQDNPFLSSEAMGLRRIPGKATAELACCMQTHLGPCLP